jgi:hypothetical protein
MWQVPRCHPVQDYHTVIPFQHKHSTKQAKHSTKQAKHETKNKQKPTCGIAYQTTFYKYFRSLNY